MKTIYGYISIVFLMWGCDEFKGPTGPKGTPGVDGNANVHVRFYTASSSDWVLSGSTYKIQLTNTDITQDVADYGAVLVYQKSSSTNWELLPITVYLSGTTTLSFSTVYDVNAVAIFVNTNNSTPLYPNFTIQYKFITIASLAKTPNDINWNDYNDVNRKLNLID
jgi:hypothetical protein